ncbi:hypothetical protein GCM10010406_09030 [Streptomyces thermolineatus]|uniref:Uncharacterized protein n=1 Tax=Streptomyces thermolineatus TaxID=44033 RepID=A0ABN3L320_9ACTN
MRVWSCHTFGALGSDPVGVRCGLRPPGGPPAHGGRLPAGGPGRLSWIWNMTIIHVFVPSPPRIATVAFRVKSPGRTTRPRGAAPRQIQACAPGHPHPAGPRA